jgi:hypothetical protein
MKEPPVYKHSDRLGQPIQVGAYVAFTWSGARGVRVGNIIKLTAKRVKIAFTTSYMRDGEKISWPSFHITRPEDCLILSETLPQELTMATLKKTI